MVKSQPVEISGHQFEKKTDALAFMKVMLNRYRPADAVNADDGAFLVEALKRAIPSP